MGPPFTSDGDDVGRNQRAPTATTCRLTLVSCSFSRVASRRA